MSSPHDPRQSVPNERVWPSKAWHETGGGPAKRGPMPWWAWLLLGLGALAVAALALVLWAAVQIGQGAEEPQVIGPPPTTAAAEPTPEPAETVNESATQLFREMNAEFPADQEAYLNGMVDDAREVYVGQDNRVLLAMGLAVCLKYEQGDSTAAIVNSIPAEYDDAQSGRIVGLALKHLCPEHIPAAEDDLAAANIS